MRKKTTIEVKAERDRDLNLIAARVATTRIGSDAHNRALTALAAIVCTSGDYPDVVHQLSAVERVLSSDYGNGPVVYRAFPYTNR